MDKPKKERLTKYNGKLSLYPLKFEEAVKDLLQVKSSKNGKDNQAQQDG